MYPLKKQKRSPVYATKSQLQLLQETFDKNDNPILAQRKQLAKETGLDVHWVTDWFRRQRNLHRKQKEASMSSTSASTQQHHPIGTHLHVFPTISTLDEYEEPAVEQRIPMSTIMFSSFRPYRVSVGNKDHTDKENQDEVRNPVKANGFNHSSGRPKRVLRDISQERRVLTLDNPATSPNDDEQSIPAKPFSRSPSLGLDSSTSSATLLTSNQSQGPFADSNIHKSPQQTSDWNALKMTPLDTFSASSSTVLHSFNTSDHQVANNLTLSHFPAIDPRFGTFLPLNNLVPYDSYQREFIPCGPEMPNAIPMHASSTPQLPLPVSFTLRLSELSVLHQQIRNFYETIGQEFLITPSLDRPLVQSPSLLDSVEPSHGSDSLMIRSSASDDFVGSPEAGAGPSPTI